MRAVPVVAVNPSWQLGGTFLRGAIGLRVGPLAQAGLNEALGLTVCLGRIGLGADVLEAEALAGPLKSEGFVARAVVGYDALDRRAQARIVGDRSLQEGDGDADMYVFPARSLATRTQIDVPARAGL